MGEYHGVVWKMLIISIIYHCKSVFDEIDISQYDNVILQRTDVEARLDMVDFNLVTDSVVYRWFDNVKYN